VAQIVQVQFGSRLAEARREKGLTQRQLALAVGYAERTVAAWEAGDRSPRSAALTRLAGVLGVSVSDLYADHPEKAAA
jgi:repressor LexA